MLIDTGAGTLLGPTLGKLLVNLRAAGYQPEQIDDVFVTHMHPDHVGGLMIDGMLAFPNATLHADKRDSDYWLSQGNLDTAPADAKGYFQGAMASVNPYVAAGKYHRRLDPRCCRALPQPGVTIAFDSDPTAAAASRKQVFGEIASKGLLVGAEHLQFPALGHLIAAGKSWQWAPANYSTQLH